MISFLYQQWSCLHILPKTSVSNYVVLQQIRADHCSYVCVTLTGNFTWPCWETVYYGQVFHKGT